jgi:hypothetical protein
MAEDEVTRKQKEAVQARLEADRAVVEESNRQFAERAKGKPTPTQQENDRAKLGEHVTEKEDDGSGPDLLTEHNERALGKRSMTADKKPGETYQTRQLPPSKTPGG